MHTLQPFPRLPVQQEIRNFPGGGELIMDDSKKAKITSIAKRAKYKLYAEWMFSKEEATAQMAHCTLTLFLAFPGIKHFQVSF